MKRPSDKVRANLPQVREHTHPIVESRYSTPGEPVPDLLPIIRSTIRAWWVLKHDRRFQIDEPLDSAVEAKRGEVAPDRSRVQQTCTSTIHLPIWGEESPCTSMSPMVDLGPPSSR